jgi:hypothetical protein
VIQEPNKAQNTSCGRNTEELNVKVAELQMTLRWNDVGTSVNVAHSKHLGKAATRQNLIPAKIRRESKLGNGCYLTPSRLLSKNVNINRFKRVILPVVLYG